MEKKKGLKRLLMFVAGLSVFISASPQEGPGSDFSVGVDLYSSYIWRGSKYGSGPAIQPSIKYSKSWFQAGAWGSFDLNGYQEADLFFSVALPAGFSAGITDYYYPGLQYNDWSDASGSHAYEVNLGFAKGGLSLTANYVINEAGGAGSQGGDMYLQAGYGFKYFNVFAGAGNGWHTYDSETGESAFAVCNLGMGVGKSIKITESYAVLLSGQLIFNPDRNQMFLVAGFSF